MQISPEKPIAGLLAPLFALRRHGDLGIGDVGALREFIDWAARRGFRLVQLLPINETGNDHSPYNAISSVALDPQTIEITPEALPDLTREAIGKVLENIDLDLLRAGPVIYREVKPLKLRLLARAFDAFSQTCLASDDERARAFHGFCEAEAEWLDAYSLFRVLMDENGGSEDWEKWPPSVRDLPAALGWLSQLPAAEQQRIERARLEAKYRQWIAWTQWRQIKIHAEARGVALMGDIPFGVSLCSADTWAHRGFFDLEWFGGCPPERILLEVDAFTRKWGQNWGIPLYRWDALRADDFSWWRRRVRKVRDVFHLYRIDHVLGVFRIYAFPWKPQRNAEFLPLSEEEAAERTGERLPHFIPHDDETPGHRAANRAQGEEILRVLIEESGEHRLVGEDLGVVPPYVRPCMAGLGIAGFKIPQWEATPEGPLIPGSEYERLSLATFATHDHEPIRPMWENWMAAIAAAEHGGSESWPARDKAWFECRQLAAWCGFEVPSITAWSDEIHAALLAALLRCDAWLAVMMITDLFASTQRFNIPGALSDANWSQRLVGTPKEWDADPAIAPRVERIATLLRETGRAGEASERLPGSRDSIFPLPLAACRTWQKKALWPR
jgi:4-alpha-glucanotransferase